MFELKPLTADAIPRALDKAERYRLLNEPMEAESICHDILRIESDHQQALIVLLLALTDQFGDGAMGGRLLEARDVVPRLHSEYDRAYYAGIVTERYGKAQLRGPGPGAHRTGIDCIRDAMAHYERAADVRPPGNDDALLRWNACARLLMRTGMETPQVEERFEPQLE